MKSKVLHLVLFDLFHLHDGYGTADSYACCTRKPKAGDHYVEHQDIYDTLIRRGDFVTCSCNDDNLR